MVPICRRQQQNAFRNEMHGNEAVHLYSVIDCIDNRHGFVPNVSLTALPEVSEVTLDVGFVAEYVAVKSAMHEPSKHSH